MLSFVCVYWVCLLVLLIFRACVFWFCCVCVVFFWLPSMGVGRECLEDRAFSVYVFVEGGAWYVYECVLVVFVECVGVVFVPPGEVWWDECGG